MREGLTFDDVLLVPRRGVLTSRRDANISVDFLDRFDLGVPILSANMPAVTTPELAIAMERAGGLGVLHRFNTIEEAVEEFATVLAAGAFAIVSLGLKDGLERASKLYEAGARVFLLDVAHGDSEPVYGFLEAFNKQQGEWGKNIGFRNTRIIVGNVATSLAAYNLAPLCDALKVGIGPGAACITREVTGFGVPQLTAIMEVRSGVDQWRMLNREHYRARNFQIIADGGIKNSGDIVKAIAAGADVVMLGRLLAGTEETGDPTVYYGNASYRLNGHNAPEGIATVIERTGTVEEVIKQLAWGIRSGLSYAGARNLSELRMNAEFMRVSPLSQIESHARV